MEQISNYAVIAKCVDGQVIISPKGKEYFTSKEEAEAAVADFEGMGDVVVVPVFNEGPFSGWQEFIADWADNAVEHEMPEPCIFGLLKDGSERLNIVQISAPQLFGLDNSADMGPWDMTVEVYGTDGEPVIEKYDLRKAIGLNGLTPTICTPFLAEELYYIAAGLCE